jgi:glycosyltransferase involved in cell wall biosynthesis
VPALTIGMATYDDFDGVYFTLQALRLYHDLSDTELIVVDNFGCGATRQLIQDWTQVRYISATDVRGTSAPRDLIFREARGETVLCCDSHVLFLPGTIDRLRRWVRDHPESNDLIQGPLVYDDGRSLSSHFQPVWRNLMWGDWTNDPRGANVDGPAFEIPMQGLGVFACRRRAWPGFNTEFRGFGGEEGYIHEKFRQAGNLCLCLPGLRWMHRFARPSRVRYPVILQDRIRNYLIGHAELGLDLEPVLAHFSGALPRREIEAIAEAALAVTWLPSTGDVS